MLQNNQAEDSLKRNELRYNNQVINLEIWALGKYTLAHNSDD